MGEPCPFDACVLSDGDADLIYDQVDDMLIQPILEECDDLVVDSSDYNRETSQPTHKPTAKPTQDGIDTDAPTPEPTRSPVTKRPTQRPSHNPTTAEPTHRPSEHPTTADPTRRPTTARPTTAKPTVSDPTTSPTPEPSHHPTTAEPTHRPSRNPTTSDPTTSNPTTSEPTRRPTTADPTKRPTTPEPTKAPRTKAPKPVKTPSPTHGGDYGPGDEGNGGYGSKKDKNTMQPLDNQEMMAVDMNGVTETTFTGYSAQAEIVGLSSVVTMLVLFGCTMICKRGKDDKYALIEEPVV